METEDEEQSKENEGTTDGTMEAPNIRMGLPSRCVRCCVRKPVVHVGVLRAGHRHD